MTKLEQLQEELLNLWKSQAIDLSMISKIEFGDDVIFKIRDLQDQIELEKQNYVPFISEVETFNTTMGKNWQNRNTPTINPEDAEFVINFIQEELDELKEAVFKNDIVGIFDAILDITYVGLGNGALVFGLKDKIEAGYAEVQASNMSKICKTEEEAIETVKVRSEQQGRPCHYEKVGDGYVVYRDDKKIMKNLNYFPPNLNQFFTEKEIENSAKNI
jgi:predicted HAD superfamily Cof-like phosphohydrolase